MIIDISKQIPPIEPIRLYAIRLVQIAPYTLPRNVDFTIYPIWLQLATLFSDDKSVYWLPATISNDIRSDNFYRHTTIFETEIEAKIAKSIMLQTAFKYYPQYNHNRLKDELEDFIASDEYSNFLETHPDEFLILSEVGNNAVF